MVTVVKRSSYIGSWEAVPGSVLTLAEDAELKGGKSSYFHGGGYFSLSFPLLLSNLLREVLPCPPTSQETNPFPQAMLAARTKVSASNKNSRGSQQISSTAFLASWEPHSELAKKKKGPVPDHTAKQVKAATNCLNVQRNWEELRKPLQRLSYNVIAVL